MPELRKDPVVGRWVIIASERARRPGNFVDTSDSELEDDGQECSFCHNQRKVIYTGKHTSSDATGSLFADVRVVSSEGLFSDVPKEFGRIKKGLYDVIRGWGAHEIVIETPEHIANMADLETHQIRLVFETYAARMKDLEKDMQFQHALAYKNYGPAAGGNKVEHTRSHIVAAPVRPLRVKEKLIGAKEYFDARNRCVYCDMVHQELELRERIVWETQHFVAIVPFAARFLFEIWILPKNHHCDFHKGVQGNEEDLAKMMKKLLKRLQCGLDDPAYNFIIQTAPFRRDSSNVKEWKTIEQDYHWHIELIPRLTRVAGFEKGTGFYICAIPPEGMAEYLRGIEV